MLLNCGVGEDSSESLGLQGDPTSQSKRKSTLNIHWKDYAEAEAPILWPPDVKNQLIRKDPDAGKDWRQEEKGTTEDEMVGWHHWLMSLSKVGDGQGGLVSCGSWGCKELDTTKWLNWTTGSVSKESACNAGNIGDVSSVPRFRRSPGGGNGNPRQYSNLKNPMDRGSWWATVYDVAKSWTWLSN